MKQYIICKPDGTREGPYPEDMVRARLAEGIYPENTKVWRKGADSWQDISILAQQAAPADTGNAPTASAEATPGSSQKKAELPNLPDLDQPVFFFNKKIITGLSLVCLLGVSLGTYLSSSIVSEFSLEEYTLKETDFMDEEDIHQPALSSMAHTDSPANTPDQDRKPQPVDTPNAQGISALHTAAHEGNPHIVKRLIQEGANVNAISGNSEKISTDTNKNSSHLSYQQLYANRTSPLIYAALGGAADCMEPLIKAGADVNFQDEMGNTALHAAAAHGFADCVQVLIKAGADVRKKTKTGFTPLHFTMKYDAADCMELLIKAGADINTATESGELPLYVAVGTNAVNCTKALLRAGADPEAEGPNGIAPYEYISDDDNCPACLPMKRKESLLLVLKAMAAKRVGKASSAASKKTKKSISEANTKKHSAAVDSALRKCPADLRNLFTEHMDDISRWFEDYDSPIKVIQMYEKAVRLLREETGRQMPDWEVVDLVVSRVLHTL